MFTGLGRTRPGEPPPRVAVLDLGTNTVLCTVLFGDPRQPRLLRIAEDLHFVTGLGRRRGADGSLDEGGKSRALSALKHVSRRIVSMGVATSSVRGAATAACREAPNGAAFLAQVWEDLSLPFDVIDGTREAELMALAQVRSFPDARSLLALDIGGGSTEVALRGSDSDWSISIPVGASKLVASLGRTPTFEETRSRVSEALEGQRLGPVPNNACLVGVSGTVTTALQVLDEALIWDPTTLHGRTLKAEQALALARRMIAMTPAQRLTVPGLHPGRADAIGPSLMWLCALLERLGRDELLVSDRGVRFGLLFETWPRAVVRY